MWRAQLPNAGRAKRGGWGAILVLLGAALIVGGCQDGYPIAATRCDRWCDIRQATECGSYDPAGCVVSCEQVAGGAACHPEFDSLLACLEKHEHEIECDLSSYGVVPACKGEQAALHACGMLHAPQRPSGAE
jgi:hypothetical protein